MKINTTKGEMDESLLEKREGRLDTDYEHTTWVEYWLGDELVHRSAHVTLTEAACAIANPAGLALFK